MTWWSDLRQRFGGGKPPIITTIIDGATYEVSEVARQQAAANLRNDPQKRAAVEELLGKQMGSLEAGVRESRRRYPESYQ